MSTLSIGRARHADQRRESGAAVEALYALAIGVAIAMPILGLRYFFGIDIFEHASRLLGEIPGTAENIP